ALNTGIAPVFLEDFSPAFNYLIRQKTPTQLSQILDINEGLENRILKSIPEHQEILDLLDHIKTKRYTYTALQRGILHILLNIEKHQFNTYKEAGYAPYIRVLGFKKESQHLLGQLMEKSKIPVITNMKKSMEVLPPHALKLLEQEIQLTNVYYSQLPNKKLRTLNNEYTMPMVIV
ncbi:MAG: nucleotidyltransferase family protein, partial [Anaerotignaceae bacterium]